MKRLIESDMIKKRISLCVGMTRIDSYLWLAMSGLAKEIGQQKPIENPFTFSTHFKKRVGWSPSQYR